jgi:hypothetical protein
MGGETFLVKDVGKALQCLVDANVAQNIALLLQTNGTVVKWPWQRLIERFKSVELNVRVDGFGKYYEYIRYPAKWKTVARNIEVLRKLPNVVVTVFATLQFYNALNIVELLQYLDSVQLNFGLSRVHFPRYLSIKAMPPRARRLAAERLRSYLEQDCRPHHREMLRCFVAELEAPGDSFDVKLMRDFMMFTNDLDVSRAQSCRDIHGELLEIIADTGFVCTNETLHATSSSAGPKRGKQLPLVVQPDPVGDCRC